MVDNVTIIGVLYHLQSATIYTGSGFTGHWHSIVNEEHGYTMYDDTKEPKILTANELKLRLNEGVDFVYVAEDQTALLIDSRESSSQSNILERQSDTPNKSGQYQPSNKEYVNQKEIMNEESISVTRPLNKGEKILTMNDLFEHNHACKNSIKIRYVQSDVDDNPTTSTGPWIYRTVKNTTIFYSSMNNGIETHDKIMLQNLKSRGFPKQSDST